jgi:endonuclease III
MARATRAKVTAKKAARPKGPSAKASKIKQKPVAKVPAGRTAKPRGTRWPKPVPPETVVEIFARFAKANPHPRGELHFKNPFTLLIAVVLSAQATDAGVNKATPALFAAADTPEKMLALGEDKVRDFVKTIGLYRAKAKNIIGLSRALIDRFGSEVPRNRDELESLPGVGRKTANVVLNTAFGEPTIAVDTHVFRVSNRIPLAPGKTPEAVEQGLEKAIPELYKQHAHHWLILHGRYICVARKPRCWGCLIEDLCRWPDKTPDPAP